MFAKISVAGADQAPLYRLLTGSGVSRQLPANARKNAVDKQHDSAVRWNFEKFLVSRTGDIVARFDPEVVPLDPILVGAVKKELAA
jgi:glutathione peroxidase